MKKTFRKLSILLCAVLTMTMLLGMTVFAGSEYDNGYDFGMDTMTLAPGQKQVTTIHAPMNYSCYVVGNKSKQTYAEVDGNSGTHNMTIHVGSDETAKSVQFWFYADDHAAVCDYITVNIKGTPAAAAQTATGTATAAVTGLASAPVTFADNTAGTVAVLNSNQVALVTDAASQPLAAFGVTNAKGSLIPMQLGSTTVINGISYFTVNTAAGTAVKQIAIQAADKQALMIRGIGGLYLNGSIVLWP